MPLSNEQIISGLIAYYRQRGVDLSYILGDELFSKLPPAEKVEIIKNKAAEIVQGSSPNFSKSEKLETGVNLLEGAGVGALMGGIGANAIVKANLASVASRNIPGVISRSRNMAILGGAIGGATIGLLGGYLASRQKANARAALYKELQNAANNPTDINAIGALSAANVHNISHSARALLVDKALKHLDSVRPTLKDVGSTVYSAYYMSDPRFHTAYKNELAEEIIRQRGNI